MNARYLCLLLFLINFYLKGFSTNTIDSLEKEVKKYPHKDTVLIDKKYMLAFAYLHVSLDSSKKIAHEIVAESESLNYLKGLCFGHKILGNIDLLKGDFTPALKHYEQALIYAGDEEKIVINNLLAATLLQIQEYTKAMNYLLVSLNLLENKNDDKLAANTYFYLGMTYEYQEKYDQSLKYYFKSCEYKRKIKDKFGEANCLSNIGNVFIKKSIPDSAIFYTTEAKKIYADLNYSDKIATTLINLASIYQNSGDEKKALDNLQEALKYLDQEKHKTLLSATFLNIAQIQRMQKKFTEAEFNALKSLNLALESGDKNKIIDIYDELSKIFSSTGNYKNAHEYAQLRNNLKDSVVKTTNQRVFEEMQTKYETKEKEKEIELFKEKDKIKTLELQQSKIIQYTSIVLGIVLIIILLLLYNRYLIKQKTNIALEEKNKIIEKQQKNILESINYAEGIQRSILKPEEEIAKYFKEVFIYYKPKAIVSGDFYWFAHIENKSIIAAVDCTGHGVPGAFMSMLGNSLLNEIIVTRKIFEPAEILKLLHLGVYFNLQQDKKSERAQDGMDISLCVIDHASNTLEFSGAQNPAYLLRNNELHVLKATPKGIGGNISGNDNPMDRTYDSIKIDLITDDIIYLFSDGYMDQFGGNPKKKFSAKKFKEVLCETNSGSIIDKKEILSEQMMEWMNHHEQIDDQMIIGIRY